MDNRDWQLLKILYEEKNITKTAEKLYISQPALTNRIKQIEKFYNTKIAIRGRRGIQFTPQGEYLAKEASELLRNFEEIKENIVNMEHEVAGTLKIAVSRYFTKYQLPQILQEFKEIYPNVEYRIITEWSSNVFNLIYNRDVHIGILRGDYTWSEHKHLMFVENICLASSNVINLENLPKMPRIDYHTDAILKSYLDNWWSENYTAPPFIYIEVDQVDTCKEMITHGLGYGIVPSRIIAGVKNINKINITRQNGEPILRNTWMFYNEESKNLKLVSAFIDFIKGFNFN